MKRVNLKSIKCCFKNAIDILINHNITSVSGVFATTDIVKNVNASVKFSVGLTILSFTISNNQFSTNGKPILLGMPLRSKLIAQ